MKINFFRLLSAGASLLQFFPLTIFVYIAFLHDKPQAADWLNAFLAGGAAAGLQFILACVIFRGRPLNRLLMGVNAYLMIGGVSVLTNQLAILQMLNGLRESGIFLCILAVGIVTTLGTEAGFVGGMNWTDASHVKRCSLGLLILTLIATAASFHFRGNLTLSAVIPLVALAVVNRLLKRGIFQERLPPSGG